MAKKRTSEKNAPRRKPEPVSRKDIEAVVVNLKSAAKTLAETLALMKKNGVTEFKAEPNMLKKHGAGSVKQSHNLLGRLRNHILDSE